MKSVKMSINGQEMSGFVMKHGSTVWVHVNGRTFTYESEKSRSQKNRQNLEDPSKIFAPMPGKIIKVFCKEGDKVTKNQTIVVMEAMKMEYALKAQTDGSIKTLKAQPGAQASLGDLLVELQ